MGAARQKKQEYTVKPGAGGSESGALSMAMRDTGGSVYGRRMPSGNSVGIVGCILENRAFVRWELPRRWRTSKRCDPMPVPRRRTRRNAVSRSCRGELAGRMFHQSWSPRGHRRIDWGHLAAAEEFRRDASSQTPDELGLPGSVVGRWLAEGGGGRDSGHPSRPHAPIS